MGPARMTTIPITVRGQLVQDASYMVTVPSSVRTLLTWRETRCSCPSRTLHETNPIQADSFVDRRRRGEEAGRDGALHSQFY